MPPMREKRVRWPLKKVPTAVKPMPSRKKAKEIPSTKKRVCSITGHACRWDFRFRPVRRCREIADVDGDERDDAGGKEGEQPLQEDEEKLMCSVVAKPCMRIPHNL